MGERPTVFISYCESEKALKDRLVEHLGLLRRQGLLELWDDTRIGAGKDRSKEIERAVRRARVAILIVSAAYLTSDFILENELRRLLERRKEEGLCIIPILARPCAWEEVDWLCGMLRSDEKALSAFTECEADEFLKRTAKEVLDRLKSQPVGWKVLKEPRVSVGFFVAITSTGLMIKWSGIGGIYMFAFASALAGLIAVAVMTAGWFALQWVSAWVVKAKSGSTVPALANMLGGAGVSSASSSTAETVGVMSIVAGSVGAGSGLVASNIAEPASDLITSFTKPSSKPTPGSGMQTQSRSLAGSNSEVLPENPPIFSSDASDRDASFADSGVTEVVSESHCDAGECDAVGPKKCLGLRQLCAMDNDCCSNSVCIRGHCCVPNGDRCNSQNDCCADAKCYEQVCQPKYSPTVTNPGF